MKNTRHAKVTYSKITNSIYIGTNFCCQVHFDKNLLKKGITVDISLQEEQLDTPFGVESYMWLPTKDHYAPSSYQLAVGVSCIAESIKKKRKVYVHCKNGHGRAPTLVAAYLASQGMLVEKAIEAIAKERPEIHMTKTQIIALKKFKKSLQRRK
jgi:protein-tyrosine phosphatase